MSTATEPEETTEPEYQGEATYSPEDNKLRIYAFHRLDNETWARMKANGWKWAPKQELFVAPKWTPEREDLARELCGDIGDEALSVEDRATQRAERFAGYLANRRRDAEGYRETAQALSEDIPFGQPILVGHHSARRAMRDARRIESAFNNALDHWSRAEYWEQRIPAVLAHAEGRGDKGTRERRIKGLEADARRVAKAVNEYAEFGALVTAALALEGEAQGAAMLEAFNHSDCHFSYCFTLAKYPREEPLSQYEGRQGLWSALSDGIASAETLGELALRSVRGSTAWSQRWLDHYKVRLGYERAILETQGGPTPIAPRTRRIVKRPPILNYRAPEGITVQMYYDRRPVVLEQVECSKAKWANGYKEHQEMRDVDDRDCRVRTWFAAKKSGEGCQWYAVFIKDSKEHAKPEAAKVEA